MAPTPRPLIAILGGTFDPIHNAHLRLALDLQQGLGAQCLLLPAGQPAHRGRPQATAQQRLAMCRLAVNGVDLDVDTREVLRAGPSYMVDTLADMKAQWPDANLCLCMGSDAFAGFGGWHQWPRIMQLAHVVVMHRDSPDTQNEEAARNLGLSLAYDPAVLQEHRVGQVLDLPLRLLDISATEIRTLCAQSRPIDFLVPPTVVDFIKTEQLYETC